MNTNTNSNDRENNFETISLNKLKSKDLVGNHLLFYLLIINTIIALLLLTIIINPYKSTKKYFLKLIQTSILKIKLYHISILIIGVYLYIYFYLKAVLDKIDLDKFDLVHNRLLKFQLAYELESEIWMVFIIIVCLISIYRYAYLINKEEQIKKQLNMN